MFVIEIVNLESLYQCVYRYLIGIHITGRPPHRILTEKSAVRTHADLRKHFMITRNCSAMILLSTSLTNFVLGMRMIRANDCHLPRPTLRTPHELSPSNGIYSNSLLFGCMSSIKDLKSKYKSINACSLYFKCFKPKHE